MERGIQASAPDLAKYSSQVVIDTIDGETHDRVAKASEVIVALGVILALHLVNLSVNLNHETLPGTCEVDDVWSNRVLPTKLPAVEAMVPEHRPETPFARRSPATKVPRRFAPPEPPRRTAPVIVHHGAVNVPCLRAATG
jgi:hypothetical protein